MTAPLGLFQGYGVELEYMIVDRETLAVKPIADRLIEAVAGEVVAEVELGPIAWSNELVLHVIELKTNGPAPALEDLPAHFQADVLRIDGILAPLGARLLPTAMHPWMDPTTEARLWPYEYGPVYGTFDRIFDCRGHGWANLQSVHLNLPFADDDEFGRLHAAIRFLLPILPALTASSPFVAGRWTGTLDNRLAYYARNCRRIPSVTGSVVPESADTRAAYEERILQRIYRDLEPYDPEGILRHEWVNARGAIARFDRNAIEIRILDVQECPAADIAVCAAIRSALQGLMDGRLVDPERLRGWPTAPLSSMLKGVARDGENATIDDTVWTSALGLGRVKLRAGEVWRALLDRVLPPGGANAKAWRPTLERVLAGGTLARRILRATGTEPTPRDLRRVYGRLADCLVEGTLFDA